MGRPRQFDEDEVVADALQTFWHQGYGATSIPDLLEATALERGSLYKAFGDKHSLFLRALTDYLHAGRAALTQVLSSAEPPTRRLQACLAQVAKGCSGSSGGPGCLAVNTMVEFGVADASVRDLLTRHWDLVQRLLERVLREGQAVGQFRDDVPARDLARTLLRLIVGIAVFARQGNCSDVNQTIVQLMNGVKPL